MKLENQVANPSQCKRLKEIGIVQEGQFSWLWDNHEQAHIVSTRSVESLQLLADSNRIISVWKERVEKGIFSAWSVAEISQMLPDLLETKNKQYELVIIKEEHNTWLCRYVRGNNLLDVHPFVEPIAKKTLAEVLAEMLIHLFEINQTTINDCNERLQEA